MAEVGEQSGQPGGDLSRDLGGEWRGELGLYIGVARGRNGRGIKGIKSGMGSYCTVETVTGEKSGRRWKTTDGWGPRVSESG
jgi:hypothetical protein